MHHPEDTHVHFRPCTGREFPGEKTFVIELHERRHGDVRWSIGLAVGHGRVWRGLAVGGGAWTPAFPSKQSLATALMMARGDHPTWTRPYRPAPGGGAQYVAPEVVVHARLALETARAGRVA